MRDGAPYPETLVITRVLESALAREPNHPGAIHFYIHTVEVGRPELAEAAAERLLTLAPGAGHLVHMPSHIFRRLGRYADASRTNEMAIAADEDCITQCRAQGVYPLAYTATGRPDDAARELGRLQQIAAMDSLKGLQVTFSRNGARAILEIAVEVLAGELAAARGDLEQAIVRLHRGVLLEDNLIYMEPPDWHVPVRQSLGAVLLAAGRAAEAWSVDLLDLEGRSLQQRGNRETLRLHLLRRQPQRSGHGSKVSM
jgi:tetratricopeptide (TPR) repeat protein